MTHEEFMGLKLGDPFKLTDEDRRMIEVTGLWKKAVAAERLRLATDGLRHALADAMPRWLVRWYMRRKGLL